MNQRICVPHWHPATLNELLKGRWHSAKLKKRDKNIIWAYGKKAKITQAKTKRRVNLHIVLAPTKRAADPDAYFKSLNDALVFHGYLIDDNRQWCEFPSPTFARGTETGWGTVVTLEDL